MSSAKMVLPKTRPFAVSVKSQVEVGKGDLIVIPVDEADVKDKKTTATALVTLDKALGGAIANLLAFGDFEGKWMQTSTSLVGSGAGASRVLLVGTGKKADYAPARARQVGLKAAEEFLKCKAVSVTFCESSRLTASAELMCQMGLGLSWGTYKYPNMNLSDEQKAELEKPIQVHLAGSHKDLSNAVKELETVAEATRTCRLLQDGPPNVVTPKYVSQIMGERATALGLSVQVWGAQKLKEMGFHAMMAVGGGSANEPQFVVIEYKPASYKKTVAFVGKGLTMDTGGYSLKPADSQVGMKYDMSGAAITLNTVVAAAALKLPVRIFGIAALCENMVDAHAYRVGDVLQGYSGKTIEIMNTDAEGRVVLSDALAYTAKELKPDYMVEYSTLTGAMVIALGQVGAGFFTWENEELSKAISAASEKTGERTWQLPTWEEIADGVKGTLADVNNIGAPPRSGGSIGAACFLKEFAGDVPYAHVDIAGVANDSIAIGFPKKISSGFGVQLSLEIARKLGG